MRRHILVLTTILFLSVFLLIVYMCMLTPCLCNCILFRQAASILIAIVLLIVAASIASS